MSFLDPDEIICLAEIHNGGFKEAIFEGKRILVFDGDVILSMVINATMLYFLPQRKILHPCS